MRASTKGMVVAVYAGQCPALDRLIDEVRHRLAGRKDFSFPRRIITRPVVAGDELHQTVTPAQFEELRRSGQFCCAWSDGGRNFALPRSVADDLAAGRRVVVAAGDVALPVLCDLDCPVLLLRLVGPGEQAEPAPGLCESEMILTAEGDAATTAEALAQRLLTLRPSRPARPPAVRHAAG